MLRSHQGKFALLQKGIDILIVLVSWVAAYQIRFRHFDTEYLWYFKFSLILLFLQYYFFRKFGLYSSYRLKNSFAEMLATLKANTSVIVLFILSVYFLSPEKISRAVLINYSILSTVLLILIRLTIRVILKSQRAKGLNLRHVLLIGDGPQMLEYIKILGRHPELGLKVKGWFNSNGLSELHKILDVKELTKESAKNLGVDFIVVGYAMKNFSKVDDILKTISNQLVDITILPDLSHALIGHVVGDFDGLPTININQPKFSTKSIILKRSFDFIVSFIGLVFISPLLTFIAIGVKMSSQGPILFGQRRIGLDGHAFLMWKFRSMRVDSESSGAGWTTKDDPRKTKFGTFLRKTSLDELPQLWNVFIGDMSLVGPRPEQPYFVDKFRDEIPAYMLRHKMKAGITGWAQVNGWRGDTSIPARIECDIWYIKNWSIWLDIGILFMTFWRGVVNKNAY